MWRLFPITSEDTSLILSSHRQLNIYHKAQTPTASCVYYSCKIMMLQTCINTFLNLIWNINYVLFLKGGYLMFFLVKTGFSINSLSLALSLALISTTVTAEL